MSLYSCFGRLLSLQYTSLLTREIFFGSPSPSSTISNPVTLEQVHQKRLASKSVSIKDEPKISKNKEKVTKKQTRRKRKSTSETESNVKPQDTIEKPPIFPFEGSPSSLELTNSFQNHEIERLEVDGDRRYLVKYPQQSYCFPSVTTILDATMSRSQAFRLYNWEKSMIKEHGRSKSVDIRKGILQSGTAFHKVIENVLKDHSEEKVISIKPNTRTSTSVSSTPSSSPLKVYKPKTYRPVTSIPKPFNNFIPSSNIIDSEDSVSYDEEIIDNTIQEDTDLPTQETQTTENMEEKRTDRSDEEHGKVSGYRRSVDHVLKNISGVCAIESIVSHLELGYTGMFDCLAHYKGTLCVIDWKTSIKQKPLLSDCFNNPLQAAAYAGAINQDHNYPFKVFNALIVVVYGDGEPAHAHFLSHEQLLSYWREWLTRVHKYHTRFATDLSSIDLP